MQFIPEYKYSLNGMEYRDIGMEYRERAIQGSKHETDCVYSLKFALHNVICKHKRTLSIIKKKKKKTEVRLSIAQTVQFDSDQKPTSNYPSNLDSASCVASFLVSVVILEMSVKTDLWKKNLNICNL